MMFSGRIFRGCRVKKGEYIPSETDRSFNYCLICALVCTIGEKPKRG
ncbi:MAG: hypothetical protein SVY15_09205 [Halobacteriota archaeon]|nr:hypothetical protein [Halobacteriota archaeon]